MKRMEEGEEETKTELLKTIKGDNFHSLGEQFPKPNYQSQRKQKIQKAMA